MSPHQRSSLTPQTIFLWPIVQLWAVVTVSIGVVRVGDGAVAFISTEVEGLKGGWQYSSSLFPRMPTLSALSLWPAFPV